ncbi:MAG: hypothetical protein JXR32_01555 [Anaerolineaceae bacterium]|nr:hypothetical protein [Anaerolineaceae bacterium]
MRPIYKSALLLALVIISLNLGLLVYGQLSAGSDYVFGGIVYNPLDGNSYIAKMRQGYDGAWRFTLPYECNPGRGAFIYLYYLFLGHLSAWLGVSCMFMYHLSRMVNAIMMLLALAALISKIIPDLIWAKRTLWLCGLGSGMGWLVLPFNLPTADMWLAEGYPFLSILANPHFPLGLAVFLVLLIVLMDTPTWPNAVLVFVLCLLLSVIQPFLLVTILILIFTVVGFRIIMKDGSCIKFLLFGLVGGVPYLVYQFWVLQSDPILSEWTAQNKTPAPEVWNLLLSLSPAIILALITVILYKRLISTHKYTLVIWLLVPLILAYLPFALQRRFLAGIYIICSLLAVLGILMLFKKPETQTRIFRIVLSLSIPGSIIILLIMTSGIISHSSYLYLTRSEYNAIVWLKNNTPGGSLVLASPELGAFIPAHSDNCVIYGHEFESINSAEREKALISFFSGKDMMTLTEHIPENVDIAYLFYGPRERSLGDLAIIENLAVVYANDEVIIYEYPQE